MVAYTFLGNKNRLKKKKSKLEPFFYSTSFFKDLFFKVCDLSSETVYPAAPEAFLYPNRWAPLKEQNTRKKSLLSVREKQSPGRVYMSKKLKLLHMLMPQGKISLTL